VQQQNLSSAYLILHRSLSHFLITTCENEITMSPEVVSLSGSTTCFAYYASHHVQEFPGDIHHIMIKKIAKHGTQEVNQA
jgi:hypothetical protein